MWAGGVNTKQKKIKMKDSTQKIREKRDKKIESGKKLIDDI